MLNNIRLNSTILNAVSKSDQNLNMCVTGYTCHRYLTVCHVGRMNLPTFTSLCRPRSWMVQEGEHHISANILSGFLKTNMSISEISWSKVSVFGKRIFN